MGEPAIFFSREREHRCQAALARDLAATAPDRAARQQHLTNAARRAAAVPGSLNETLLIRR
ncbi:MULTISPECIES: hypothetical protein [Sphingomonas]|jgi:hypothetical protein|uniref:hypothetical protein n=1 Tax=Sphingomonas TaxID=13687 RepID=UPI0010424093|nr:hypothetical protein [Sphingomonas turrisvirgatae]